MRQWIIDSVSREPTRTTYILIGSIVTAFVVKYLGTRLLLFVARRTTTDFDDKLVETLKRPIFASIVLGGLAWALSLHELDQFNFWLDALIKTIAACYWGGAIIRIGVMILLAFSERETSNKIIQQRTVPIFIMFWRIAVIGMAIYFSFLFWHIDVTAWIASAGIIGIAIGFGAKDTLSNLFAGIFILADGPYKIGDFIHIEGSLSGTVSQIGMRSTRIITLENTEINVPNSVMGSSKIVNELAGPSTKQRIHADVGVGYNSDIATVRHILLRCPLGIEGICESPSPDVIFVEIGASSLNFKLRVWIEDPKKKAVILDKVYTNIFNHLSREGIEIPFNIVDLNVKELPTEVSA